jgi:hypothetical protein
MQINGVEYQFDRIVKVTMMPFIEKIDANGKMTSTRSKEEQITFLFDTQHEKENKKDGSQYCTRIDFNVKQFGRVDALTIGRTIAKISIYNIDSKISQLLNAYNVYDNSAKLLSIENKSWKINLQVGFNGGTLTTLFTGTINSFNKDRIQNEESVDTVWNFYCNAHGQSKEISSYTEEMRALPGENYSEITWGVGNKSISWENAIKEIICNKIRNVKERYDVASYVSKPASFALGYLEKKSIENKFGEKIGNNLVAFENYKEVTPQNFDKYYKIFYASSVKGKENLQLKNKWKTSITEGISVKGDTLEETLSQLAKKLDNCHVEIVQDPCELQQIILIYPAGSIARGVMLGKEWTIHNFANLLTEPSIDDSSLKLSFIMEPKMLINDYIRLTIDDKIGRTGASFNLTSGSAYDVNQFTSTGFVGGIVGATNNYDIESAKKYGNIFFKWYFIFDIEHVGSTHEATWQTNVVCNGKGNDNV